MIEISFQKGEDGSIEGAIKTANAHWSEQAAWKRKVDKFAVKELLPLKNEAWLGDNETKFTPKQFLSRMKLTSVSVSENGYFEFWHDDGNLFWGHSIQICGSLADGLTDADIPG